MSKSDTRKYELRRAKDGSFLYSYNHKDFMCVVNKYMEDQEEEGWSFYVDSIHDIDFEDIILN